MHHILDVQRFTSHINVYLLGYYLMKSVGLNSLHFVLKCHLQLLIIILHHYSICFFCNQSNQRNNKAEVLLVVAISSTQSSSKRQGSG